MKSAPHFSDKQEARKAGRKGGKVRRPGTRYFSVNREAAAAAGRKSQYARPKKPPPDYTMAKAFFESIGGDYPKIMPWSKLGRKEWEYWRKQALAAEQAAVPLQHLSETLT